MLAQGTTVGNLPVEIIQRICGELKTLPDLLNVACTCKAASLLAQDPQVIAAVLLNRIRYGSIVSYEIQIKYLAPSVTEKLLCDFFASCDVITSCQIRSGTRMRKHEAFIRFQTLQGLKRALALNGRFMRGGALSITNASSQNRKVKLLELTASIGYATTALIDWCTVDSPSGTSVKGGTDAEIPLQVHRPYGVIKILKARGARVSGQKSQHEKTETRISKFSLIDDPLYFAVRSGQISIVKELLDCGANPFLNSHAALIHAVSRGYNAIAVTIASFQYKSASQSANAKLLASELMEFAINLSLRYFSNGIFDQLVAEATEILKTKPDVIDLSRCLYGAVELGDDSAVSKLLTSNANVVSEAGLNAISKSCSMKKREVCRALVSSFNNLLTDDSSMVNDWSRSELPQSRSIQLVAASMLGNTDDVRHIIAIPISENDNYGPDSNAFGLAASAAASFGYVDVLADLLGDSRITRDQIDTRTFLDSIVAGGAETVQTLLDAKLLRVNRPDGHGMGEDYDKVEHMLFTAVNKSKVDVAKLLMMRGVRFTGTLVGHDDSPTNQSVFWRVCKNGDLTLATALLEGRVYSPNDINDHSTGVGKVIDAVLRKIAPTFSLQVLGMFPAEKMSLGVWLAFEAFLQGVRDGEKGGKIQLAALQRRETSPVISAMPVGNLTDALRLFIDDVCVSFGSGDFERFLETESYDSQLYIGIVTAAAAGVAVIKLKGIIVV